VPPEEELVGANRAPARAGSERPRNGSLMTSDGYTFELQGQACWPARVHSTTTDGLLEELGRLLDCEAVLAPFTIAFTDPVPSEVREQVCDVVLAAIRTAESDDDSSVWIDDLVDESGWQGTRATIDPALAPCFAGADDERDERHFGVWADERTFVHVEVTRLDCDAMRATSWASEWVMLSHSQPNSMTSGSWVDSLFAVHPSAGAGLLVGVRRKDDDGIYYSVTPREQDPAAAARQVAEFIAESQIGGVSHHLVPLIAHGLSADGTASAFPVDLLPGADNPGYEVSRLVIRPPAPVWEALLCAGALDARGARALREAIVAGAKERWGVEPILQELDDDWWQVLSRLEQVIREGADR